MVSPTDGSAVAYLGRGECFGEIALLTASARTMDVRVPQHAELLVIDRALFDDLMENHSGFARQLCVILAHRLGRANENRPQVVDRKKELQGNLEYFDLATVVQTLISSSQTGVMTLSSDEKTNAQLFFQTGNIFRAHYGHRRGDEAVHHLFQKNPGGEFLFESGGVEAIADGPDPGITVPAMALMMESVRLQDELKILLSELPANATRIERNAAELKWSDHENQADARQLWGSLHAPQTVSELMERANSCYYHSARILTELLQTEQIKLAIDS